MWRYARVVGRRERFAGEDLSWIAASLRFS
jgi:hypothetical protein